MYRKVRREMVSMFITKCTSNAPQKHLNLVLPAKPNNMAGFDFDTELNLGA